MADGHSVADEKGWLAAERDATPQRGRLGLLRGLRRAALLGRRVPLRLQPTLGRNLALPLPPARKPSPDRGFHAFPWHGNRLSNTSTCNTYSWTTATDPDRPTITIELSGDPSTFDALKADEDSEWSWAVYPPGFCLRSFPAQIDPATGIIYMMEHSDIDDVTVQLVPDRSLEISGRVDLFGEIDDFAIRWQR